MTLFCAFFNVCTHCACVYYFKEADAYRFLHHQR